MGGLLLERARTELESARNLLDTALRSPEDLRASQERQVNALCYRAIVLNYDALLDLSELERRKGLRRESDGDYAEYVGGLKEALAGWIAEHPDDHWAESELARLENKHTIRVD